MHFQVSPQNLWGRILRILVYNIDVNRKHRVLGQTLLELVDVDLSQGRLVSYFYALRACSVHTASTNVQFSK